MAHAGHAFPSAADADLKVRVAAWVRHLEHVLPAQAPIRNFVHHNTLHGLQHLPFADALREAARITGAWPWMDEARARECHAAGRIDDSDLDAALDEWFHARPGGVAPLADRIAGFPGLDRRCVLRAALVSDLAPPTAARLHWLLDEGRLDAARWQATASLAPPLATLAAADAALSALVAEVFAQPAMAPRWRDDGPGLWARLVARVGHDWTLVDLLRALTGEDVLAAVRPTLIRQLGAHLDLGMAQWPHPSKHRGFYAAWRESAGRDIAWELDELVAARDEIAQLPDDPVDTIGRELMHLGPDEAHWGDYLQRLALDLPGWSGMFLWRDVNAARFGESNVPVAMADYLAVRLVLERLYCEDLVHRTWGLPLFLSELGDHFLAQPAELWVRHACFAGLLDEASASEALRLVAAVRVPAEAWQALADRVATVDTDEADLALRLRCYRIATALDLTAGALAAAGEGGLRALAAVADELDAHARGEIRLLAYERHYREQVFAALVANHGRAQAPAAPAAQLVFCMDDREEGTRRHLEEIDPSIDTYGAAGFFGVPMYWRGVDDTTLTALYPVVVAPQNVVRETACDAMQKQLHDRRRALRLAWRERLHRATRDQFVAGPLMAALAAPLGVAALGLQTMAPAWLGVLLQRWRTAFDRPLATRAAIAAAGEADTAVSPREGFSDAEQVARAAAFLRSIGLVSNFAPLVVIVGHGSNSANNPHAAAYDCGACSGRHGGPNARVFAAMANRPEVRAGLAREGIVIPEATWFLGNEHNTGDESLTWYDLDLLPAARQPDFDRLAAAFDEAQRRHAVERCRRFASAPRTPAPDAALQHLATRRYDWSQARPELGHATIATGFIGRRSMSRGAFFDRRVFLISYDPTIDAHGRIPEATLLAAGPVGAGIALEYYFSSVDNERFGCGSKITHNVAGLTGVMEGASSDLRTGLPRQMIEIHEPMRLLVVVEQTREIVAAIYERQPPLRELIGNGWIVVAVQEPADGALYRFDPSRGWLPWHGSDEVPRAPSSAAWLGAHRTPLAPALIGEAA